MEKAILLGRVGEHRKALRLLVGEERDENAAENYCRRTSAGRDREFTQELFSWLLQAYLESRPHVSAAVDLLNQNPVAFNLLKVLEMLPDSWSLQLVMRFLCESLRATTHDRRMRGLEKSLAMMDNLRQRHAWVRRTLVLIFCSLFSKTSLFSSFIVPSIPLIQYFSKKITTLYFISVYS